MTTAFTKEIHNSTDRVESQTPEGRKILNLSAMWKELFMRSSRTIYTVWLIQFMQTLSKNKSAGKNGISRLQHFLNALSQELSLFLANMGTLSFVGKDHYYLLEYGTGTNDPDFYFRPSNGNTYTMEAKMYFSRDSYTKLLGTTNFHNADYVIIFIIGTKEWLISRKIDNYNTLYSIKQLSDTDPQLTELVLPEIITTIQFYTTDDNTKKLADRTDAEVPETVYYRTYNNTVGQEVA